MKKILLVMTFISVAAINLSAAMYYDIFYNKKQNIFMQDPENFKLLPWMNTLKTLEKAGINQKEELVPYFNDLKQIADNIMQELSNKYRYSSEVRYLIRINIPKDELEEFQRKEIDDLEKKINTLSKNRLSILKAKNQYFIKDIDESISTLEFEEKILAQIKKEIQLQTKRCTFLNQNLLKFAEQLSLFIETIISDARKLQKIFVIAYLKNEEEPIEI